MTIGPPSTNTASGSCKGTPLVERRMKAMRRDLSDGVRRAYKAWHNMKQRCLNENSHRFPRYGGRGIVICLKWLAFNGFLEDMGPCEPGMSLERKDVNGHYEPGNCHWIPIARQAANRGNNSLIRAFGEAKTAADWSRDRRAAVPEDTIYDRVFRRSWLAEHAITKPAWAHTGRRPKDVVLTHLASQPQKKRA